MMRVAYLADRDLTALGGVETYSRTLLKHADYLQSLGVELTLVTRQQDLPPAVRRVNFYVSGGREIRGFFRFLNPLLRLYRLRRRIKGSLARSGADVVITSDYLAAVAARLSLPRRRPVIFTPGSLVAMDLEMDRHYSGGGTLYRFSRTIQKRVVTILEGLAFRLCSKSLVTSNFFLDNVRERYGACSGKVSILPLGFDLERVVGSARRQGGDDTEKMILSVSRLVRSKNIYRIIEIMALLPQQYRWTILGGGPEEEPFRQAVRDAGLAKRILIPGPVEGVADHYANCAAFVHLSYYENFGLVLLEAMVNGKPPIVLRPDSDDVRTATSEIIREGENGYFVEDDPVAVASLIRDVCENRREDLGTRAAAYARAQYSFTTYLDRLAGVLQAQGGGL